MGVLDEIKTISAPAKLELGLGLSLAIPTKNLKSTVLLPPPNYPILALIKHVNLNLPQTDTDSIIVVFRINLH